MSDDGIGRLLVASLHQAIGDVLPTRLEYYEHWLSPMGLRSGRGGRAALNAVLSFLRLEGEPAYTAVMRAAGRYSADWHHAERAVSTRIRQRLPARIRARFVLWRTRRLLCEAYRPLGVTASMRQGVGVIVLTRSVFCGLREPWPWPTCAYFAEAVARWFAVHGLEVETRIVACQTQGGDACRLEVTFPRRGATEVPS